MQEDLQRALEITKPDVPAAASDRPVSALARAGLWTAAVAAACGAALWLCERPHRGEFFPSITETFAVLWLAALGLSALALILTFAAAVRIVFSRRRVRGYGHCLGALALVIAANVSWYAVFAVNL